MGPHSQPCWFHLPPHLCQRLLPSFPRAQHGLRVQFQAVPPVQLWVLAGLVSHSPVRPHQGAVVERIMATL